MRSFEIGLPARGGSVHALEWGPTDRPVDVVFLHANGFNALAYRTILEPLGASLRVLAFDQRGHGRTNLPTRVEGRHEWLDLRDDLTAVLDAVGIEQAVLAGHSMGGTVTILAAAHEPRIARSLILFDPVVVATAPSGVETHSPMVEAARRRRAVFPSREDARRSYRGRGAFQTWPDEILDDYIEDGFRNLPNGDVALTCAPAWEASSYAAHEHDTFAAIADLTAPLRILKAEQNSTCRLELGEVSPIGGLILKVVPGTTHFLPMERPEVVREALVGAVTG